MTGSLTNNLIPDVAISQSNYSLRSFDLIYPNIEYYFEPESSLYNINKSWQQELVRYTSSNWDIAPEFKITGQGKFVNVYGQGQGFICRWGTISAPRAEITLEADHIIQNMYQGWEFNGQKVEVNVDKWWAYSGYLLYVRNNSSSPLLYNWPSQSLAYPSYSIGMPLVNININQIKWGEDQFGGISPHFGDYWGGLSIGNVYGAKYNININELYGKSRWTDRFIRVEPTPPVPYDIYSRDNTINVNIGYINAKTGSFTTPFNTMTGGHIISLNTTPFQGNLRYENMFLKAHINKAELWGVSIGAAPFYGSSNSTIIYSCNDCTNYGWSRDISGAPATLLRADLVFPTASNSFTDGTGTFRNNKFIIKGIYKNYDSQTRILDYNISKAYFSGSWIQQQNTEYNNLVLDNFTAYQLHPSQPIIRTYDFFQTGFSTGSAIVIKDSLLYSSGSNIIVRNNTVGLQPLLIYNTTMNADINSTSASILDGDYRVSSNINNLMY
jgi:hypothetical protein